MRPGTYIRTKEMREKQSLARKGHKHSEETKKKISKATKGSKNSMYGKHRYGPKNPNWKGGQHKTNDGRVMILARKHPYAQTHTGYVFRSRLVMEEKLDRYLDPIEVVHHINGIADDDRLVNLQLLPNQSSHAKLHYKSGHFTNGQLANPR